MENKSLLRLVFQSMTLLVDTLFPWGWSTIFPRHTIYKARVFDLRLIKWKRWMREMGPNNAAHAEIYQRRRKINFTRNMAGFLV